MSSNPSTAIVCMPLLDDQACDAWLAALGGARWENVRVALPGYGDGEHSMRSGEAAQIPEGAPLETVVAWIEGLNRGLYEFELSGLSAGDPALAMRYRQGDHFDWHIDNALDRVATRKLSFTVQLTAPSEYEGGDLEFAMYAQTFGGSAEWAGYGEQIRRRGAITVFPSFHLHRVSPLTRGMRTALVGWIHGPRFR